MTITPESKQAIDRAGESPERIEDPESKTAYLVVREEVYRKLQERTVTDHSDRSLHEFGEFHPDG